MQLHSSACVVWVRCARPSRRRSLRRGIGSPRWRRCPPQRSSSSSMPPQRSRHPRLPPRLPRPRPRLRLRLRLRFRSLLRLRLRLRRVRREAVAVGAAAALLRPQTTPRWTPPHKPRLSLPALLPPRLLPPPRPPLMPRRSTATGSRRSSRRCSGSSRRGGMGSMRSTSAGAPRHRRHIRAAADAEGPTTVGVAVRSAERSTQSRSGWRRCSRCRYGRLASCAAAAEQSWTRRLRACSCVCRSSR